MESERALAIVDDRVTRKVYITNFAGHDYSKAEKFGKLTAITTGYVSFHSLDRVKYQVCEAVDKADPEDFLLLSGIPVLCVIAALYWNWKHKKCKLLIHDKKADGEYRELIVSDKNFNDVFNFLNHVA